MSSNMLRYQSELGAQWAIGATRCDDKCKNAVLLETQGPCGSVRRCSGDTVTRDTSVQVKMSHVVCSVFRLPEEPIVHGDSRYLFYLLHLRDNFAVTQ